jgi:hypothetical protein
MYALLKIDQYKSIEWGVDVVFQTPKIEVVKAMKLVKENALEEEIKTERQYDEVYTPSTNTVFQIVELVN